MRSGRTLWPVAVGIGWRHPHYVEMLAPGTRGVDFLEVHTENFLAPGGPARQLLLDAATRFPLSLHGVGLGLGSAVGTDWQHLRRVSELVEAVKPALVSEHACFSRVHRHGRPIHAHVQLPIPFSERGLALLASQVDTVQQTLGCRLLIENLCTYLSWDEDSIREPVFFNTLAERTGCGLLLDLNALLVNALNRGADAEGAVADCTAWLDDIDPAAVGQYHLSGHARVDGLVAATRAAPVGEDTWAIYRHALGRIGARPTLIEWDHALPPLTVLEHEAARARREQAAFDRERIAPPPARPSSRSTSRRDAHPATHRAHEEVHHAAE